MHGTDVRKPSTLGSLTWKKHNVRYSIIELLAYSFMNLYMNITQHVSNRAVKRIQYNRNRAAGPSMNSGGSAPGATWAVKTPEWASRGAASRSLHAIPQRDANPSILAHLNDPAWEPDSREVFTPGGCVFHGKKWPTPWTTSCRRNWTRLPRVFDSLRHPRPTMLSPCNSSKIGSQH